MVPKDSVLETIISECQRSFPKANRAKILSCNRKRREYMTHRVYNHCNKHYRMRDGKEVLEMLRGNNTELDFIREESKMDVTDDNAAREFAYDRVESFFNRRKTK